MEVDLFKGIQRLEVECDLIKFLEFKSRVFTCIFRIGQIQEIREDILGGVKKVFGLLRIYRVFGGIYRG